MFCTVKINQTDTCATYAFQRIGKAELCLKVYTQDQDIEDFIRYHFELIEYNKDKLLPCDLLYWKSEKTMRLPLEIDNFGRIITYERKVKYHFGVVENDGYWSDLTRLTIEPIPIIQLRKINDWTKGTPKYILRPLIEKK